HEPGHPQELALALLALTMAVVALWSRGHVARRLGICLGFLLAAITLTKVNVGVYASGAVALVLVGATTGDRLRHALFGLLALTLVALPWVVMRLHVADWAFTYAALASLAALSSAVAMWG